MPSADQVVTVGCGQEAGKTRRISFDRLLAIVSLLFSACIVGWVLWSCRYGYDFTDEGFYLNWISRPFNYVASNTQFGFAYHPLYLLFDGSVSALRQANLVATYIFAWLAAWALLGRVFQRQALNSADRFAIAAAIATSALTSVVFAGLWLPTPSYNTLAFQGLMVAATGLFLADRSSTRASIAGWILIGVGGWLTFLGKPTSAAALAVLAAIYLILSGNIRIKQLAIALGTALGLLALTAIMIDGSIQGFVDRNREGLLIGNLLHGDLGLEKLLRLEELVLGENTLQVMYRLGGTVFLAMWLTRLKVARLAQAGSLLAAILVVLATLAVFHYIPLRLIPAEHRALLLFSVPAGVALAGLSMLRFKDVSQIGWPQLMLGLTILAFPYAYAFGTGNNYWIPIGSAGAFVVLASLTILRPLARQPNLSSMLLVAGLSLQTLVVVLLSGAFASPYRQPQPLHRNDVVMEVGRVGSKLILSESHASYLSSLTRLASQNGFQKGTPMIDLSGHSPGVLYALGADSVGVAWTLGGYPRTARFVTRGLKGVPCEQLSAAWVLSEPKGPRPVPWGVLTSFGANPENDYKIVGEMRSPEGQFQFLSKPTRNAQEAIKACEAARAGAT
jgi:hypothetical protein